jgi:transposase
MIHRAGVEVVKRNEVATGFLALRRRWIVERTFVRLVQNRRLVRDHETTESSAEAFVYLAMIRFMLNRFA